MPGGGKKAVFPPLNLHDHDSRAASSEHQERQKKLLQSRGKSMDQKDSPPEKERREEKARQQASKSEQQKTPTKDQKDLIKQEQQRIKNEQKAQQKLEKEQQKHDKELQKEHQKELQKMEKEQKLLEKEQQKMEKEQLKVDKDRDRKSPSKNCFKVGLSVEKPGPVLKTQKSLEVASLKQQKSVERPAARSSIDLQYTRDLLESADTNEFASSTSLAKVKNKK